MYYDEDLILDLRLHELDKYVKKFVISESCFTHNGSKKKLNFDIKNFIKFKDKIEYIVQEDQPNNLETIDSSDNTKEHYRKSIFNAGKRESAQRNFILEGLKNAEPNDWIIISDLDEIPNLEKVNFNKINERVLIFEQEMMYYKFNLKLQNFTWIGSKACKFKYLESPQWLRNIKGRKFNWWRIDTFFSKKKYRSIKFIKEGGWHYSYLKTPKEIEKKLKSYLHHIDYDINPLGLDKIENIIKDKKTIYDLKVDKRKNKFNAGNELVKVQNNQLPRYIVDNLDKYNNWIEK